MSAIERYNEQPLALIESIDDLARLSKQVAESRYYGDMQSAQQAAVKLMIARELGLGVTAISNMHLVDGKIQLGYQILIALVKRSGKYQMKFIERTEQSVRIEWFERNDDGVLESVGFSKFDMEDAKLADLLKPSRSGKPSNFMKYPIRMLTARAVSDGFSTYAPECAGGALYTDDEIGEVVTSREPAPRRKREATTAPATSLPNEEVVDAELVAAAPGDVVTPDEPNGASITEGEAAVATSSTPADLTQAVVKAMTAEQRKVVKEACKQIGVEWDAKLAQSLVDRFGEAATKRDSLLAALVEAVNPLPAEGTAEGEVPFGSAESFQEFIDSDNADLTNMHERLAQAGMYGAGS